MYLDSEDSLRLSINGVYEEFETKTLETIIKKDDTVIDIGSNIGYYTLKFSKWVGETGNVYAFEPEPSNFDLLQKNISINNCQNVTLVQKAVSDKNDSVKMHLIDEHPAGHRIANENDENTISVEQITLDDYFSQKHETIDFIKMDVEGSEPGVIKGMQHLLQKSQNLKIMIEFAPHLIANYGITPKEFLDLIKSCGFKIYFLDKKKKKMTLIEINELLDKFPIDKGLHTNLLLTKQFIEIH
jgi:FkbM family methyltransferase